MSSAESMHGATLVGVDLGASGVRAWRVGALDGGGRALEVAAGPFERSFEEEGGGFEAVGLEEQLAELRSGAPPGPRPGEREREEASRRTSLVAEAIAAAAGGAPARVALAAPGVRRGDGRGIVAMRNGPRMPGLLTELERDLAGREVPLAAPLPPLVGDAEAAGWGELAVRGGALGDARTALLVLAGSGLGEVLVHEGRALALEELDPPLARAWELGAGGGGGGAVEVGPGAATVEDAIAPGRLNARWLAGGGEGRLETAASAGESRARELVEGATLALAAHLARRLRELARHAVAARPERIVLGAALARMLARDAPWLASLEQHLANELDRASAADAAAPWLADWTEAGALRRGRLVLSSLRAAPALGAVSRCLSGAAPRGTGG